MTEYEKFWDEMSKTEEVDYDDERQFKAIYQGFIKFWM